MSRMDNVGCLSGFFGEGTQIVVSTYNEGDHVIKHIFSKQLHVKKFHGFSD